MAPTIAAIDPARTRMKLLVDTKARRVLFAEVGKEVADFFLSFLAMPIATVVDIVGKESPAGSVGNLYSSVEKLHCSYLQPGAAKDALLRPTMLTSPVATSNLFAMWDPSMPKNQLVRCTGTMEFARHVAGREKGLLKAAERYTVTDNLTIAPVTPMSAIPSAALLHSLGVRDLTAVQEKTDHIFYQKGVDILRASLHSQTALTDVFLREE